MRSIQRFFLFVFLLLTPACAFSQGEITARYDHHMAQLAILSQQDPRFEGITYNTVTLQMAGCGPVSMCNAVSSAFAMTDSDEAVALMKEMLPLIVSNGQYKKEAAYPGLLPNVFDPGKTPPEKTPLLHSLIGTYSGSTFASTGSLTVKALEEHLQDSESVMLCGSISVAESWEQVIRILSLLHSRGLDDATLCISHIGAGTSRTSAPLRAGKSGHYVSILLNAGTFFDSGTFYLLDSQPRYLPGEEGGEGTPYKTGYAFPDDGEKSAFNRVFTVSRLSPTILKIQPDAAVFSAAMGQKEEAERVDQLDKMLSPVILYARGMAVLRTDTPVIGQ